MPSATPPWLLTPMIRPRPAFQRRIISTAAGNTTTSSGPLTNRPSASSLPWRTVPSRSRYMTGTARSGTCGLLIPASSPPRGGPSPPAPPPSPPSSFLALLIADRPGALRRRRVRVSHSDVLRQVLRAVPVHVGVQRAADPGMPGDPQALPEGQLRQPPCLPVREPALKLVTRGVQAGLVNRCGHSHPPPQPAIVPQDRPQPPRIHQPPACAGPPRPGRVTRHRPRGGLRRRGVLRRCSHACSSGGSHARLSGPS